MCNCNRRCNSNCGCNRNCNCNSRRTCCRRNMMNNNSCVYANICNNTNNRSAFPDNYLYGHAYTPNQTMNKTFTPEVGLEHGTIFPELVSPYYPGQSMDFINYLRNGGNANE